MVGLNENPVALRWMVAGPAMARISKDFEHPFDRMDDDDDDDDVKYRHHDQGLSLQKVFQSHVKNLVSVMEEMGNPFWDDFEELIALDSCDCSDRSVTITMRSN